MTGYIFGSFFTPFLTSKTSQTRSYDQLPKGVLEELKKKTPKSEAGNYTARLHQSLTTDIGDPHLKSQLDSVIALMENADTWDEFIRSFNKVMDRRRGYQQLDLKLELKPEDFTEDIEAS